jgi:SAM-dependent methyltransferase
LPSAGLTSPLAPNARLRFDLIRRILSQINASGAFLEIGCGQGAAATVLARHFDYTGYEPDPSSYQTAQRRLMELGTGNIIKGLLPATPEAAFDVVGAFEVLEHLEDDLAAMTQWVRWLRPNGYAIVSVPAHPHRFGPWDAKVGHFRRYTRSAIETVLIDAGLVDVKAIAYGFPLGYVLEWGRHWVASRADDTSEAAGMAERTAASGRSLQPRTVAAPLIWAGTLPFVWLQRLFARGDLGTGFVAYGRRPE